MLPDECADATHELREIVASFCPQTCGRCDQERRRRSPDAANEFEHASPGMLKYPATCEKTDCEYYLTWGRDVNKNVLVVELGGVDLR